MAALCAIVLASPAPAGADLGYEGPSYSGAASQPTGHKQQSKLWVTPDGVWWGVLWNAGTSRYEIHRLDRAAHVWRPTGVVVDARSGSKADVLWDGTKLYIASAGPSATSSSDTARLTRYSYDGATRTYSPDSGFPATVASGGTTAVVIDKDSTGTLWATYTRGGQVYVVHSTTSDSAWSAPLKLPATGAGGLLSEDISTIVAYDGKIGVMWSNQNSHAIYFASHVDGAPTGEWTSSTVVSGDDMADDHINLKALQGDPNGRLYAATKTSRNESSEPLILLHELDEQGSWQTHVFGRASEDHTRPMVLLDGENGHLYVLASSPCCGGGKIYYKRTSLSNPSFQPGLGTLLMEKQGVKVNNVTASKQTLNGDTDLVALASIEDTKRYWYNEIDLQGSGTPDTTPPETTIDSGPFGTVNSSAATFSFSADGAATFECRLDGGAFGACTSPKSYSGLANGTHTFEVRAIDSAGNVDPTPASRTWTVQVASTTTLSVPAVADTYASQAQPGVNLGAETVLKTDDNSKPTDEHSYLRFTVGGVTKPVLSAKLRAYVANGSNNGPAIFATGSSWGELTLTWNNRPAPLGTVIDDKGAVSSGSFVEYDVTSLVTGDGTYDFVTTPTSSNGLNVASREEPTASRRPTLVLTLGGD